MICTEYAYEHLSHSYVIRKHLVHKQRVMLVVSGGVVMSTAVRRPTGNNQYNCSGNVSRGARSRSRDVYRE
jgi:hypothetical protein